MQLIMINMNKVRMCMHLLRKTRKLNDIHAEKENQNESFK